MAAPEILAHAQLAALCLPFLAACGVLWLRGRAGAAR
jgi:hypothetical protein